MHGIDLQLLPKSLSHGDCTKIPDCLSAINIVDLWRCWEQKGQVTRNNYVFYTGHVICYMCYYLTKMIFLFLFLILYIMKMMMEYNRPLVCRTMHIIPYQDLRAAALQFSSSRIDGLKCYCPNYPHNPINVRATEQEEEKRARVVFQSCYCYYCY